MEKYISKIINLRHELHAHPELSGQELETKRRLIDFLQHETSLEVTDRGRWFYAYYSSGKQNAEAVAFRADFDALPIEEKMPIPYCSQTPGISHKCGHDGHSAALVGFAMKLDREGADKDVYLIFQHAEEIGGGGEECAELIKEKGISRVFAFHNMSGYPLGSVILREGTAQCASKGLTVRFQGATAHASQPEDGRNPSRAIAKLVLAIEDIAGTRAVAGGVKCADTEENIIGEKNVYRSLTMATIVNIVAGSKDFGIAASKAEISMTLRAQYEQDMTRMEEAIRSCADRLAEKDGLSISYEENDVFPETANNDGCVADVRQAARRLGLEVIEKKEPFRASEDFGYYLKQCPGAIFYLGNGEHHPQIHMDTYDFPDQLLETAIYLYAELLK